MAVPESLAISTKEKKIPHKEIPLYNYETAEWEHPECVSTLSKAVETYVRGGTWVDAGNIIASLWGDKGVKGNSDRARNWLKRSRLISQELIKFGYQDLVKQFNEVAESRHEPWKGHGGKKTQLTSTQTTIDPDTISLLMNNKKRFEFDPDLNAIVIRDF